MVYTKPELSTGMSGVFYPPVSGAGQPQQMVFSLYAKGARDGDRLIVNLPFVKNSFRAFTLKPEWQRFEVAGELKPSSPYPDFTGQPGFRFRLAPDKPAGTKIWVSGLQMEAGATATEFQDD